jgi:hypothetical protein
MTWPDGKRLLCLLVRSLGGGAGGAVSQRLSCPLVGVAIGTHHFGEPATPDGLGGALGGALVLPVKSAQ